MRKVIKKILIVCVVVVLGLLGIYCYYGGLGVGGSVNPQELSKYIKDIDDIKLNDDVEVIAFGEATHGNVEFQEIRLELFKHLVEHYGVKSILIEADYVGCLKVNELLEDEDCDMNEVINMLGFKIHKTQQVLDLLEYIKAYNLSHDDKIMFYGYDMQKDEYLDEGLKELGLNIDDIKGYSDEEIELLKTTLAKNSKLYYLDIFIQHRHINSVDINEGSVLRDKYMADNILNILSFENMRNNKRVFVSGHNNHLGKYSSIDTTGAILDRKLSERYFVIGSDFYKATCNLPLNNKRVNRTFFSHNKIANALHKLNIDMGYLDFASIDTSSAIYDEINEYNYMGSLGEQYSFMMHLIPPSYRIFQQAAVLYDGMIYVDEAHAITIN